MWVHANALFWSVPSSRPVVASMVAARFREIFSGFQGVEEILVTVHFADLKTGCSCSPAGPVETRVGRLNSGAWHASVVLRMAEESVSMWQVAMAAYEAVVKEIHSLGLGAHATVHSTPSAGCWCNLRDMRTVVEARDWSEKRLNEVAASKKP